MDINKYIKELIIKNECIILSGFGGFETHYKPAHLDNVTGKLVPPSKQVVFRPDYKKDNGVLVHFVAGKEGIALDKAYEIIDDFIGNIVYKLDIGGSYVLEGLGKFIKHSDGRLVFMPSEDENFLIDSYGLSEVSIPRKEKKEDRVVVEDQSLETNDVKRSYKVLYLVTIIAVILSGMIILIYKFDLFNKLERLITNTEILKSKEPEKIVFGQKRLSASEDSIAGTISSNIDESTVKEKALYYEEQEPEKITEPEMTSIVHPGGEKKYVIVAGSFHAETYAVDFSRQLQYKGYKPIIIQTENGLYRVALDTFEEINTAIDELEKYKRQLNREIWILRI